MRIRRLTTLLTWLAAVVVGAWGYVSALDRGTSVALFSGAFWFVAVLGGGTLLRRLWSSSNHRRSQAARRALATGTVDDSTDESLPNRLLTFHGVDDRLLMSVEQKRWLKRDGW